VCREGEFVGSGDGLDDDIFVFDAGGFEGLDCAIKEGGYDFGVPSGVDDADAEGRA
jgi:hypothetical protein